MDAADKPPPGWTENLQWRGDNPEKVPSPAAAAVSYVALVAFITLLAGGALAAYPYIMAIWETQDDDRSWEQQAKAADAWIEGETKARAWWRFAAGATAGAAAISVYLIRQKYKADQRSVGKDVDDDLGPGDIDNTSL